MKKFISILLIAVLVIGLVACTDDQKPDDNNIGKDPIEDLTDDENRDDESNLSEEVTLYFANKEYIDTGNEELEKLISEKKVVEYDGVSLEEAIVSELMKNPENKNLSSSIPTTAKLLKVETSDGTAYVDFATDGMNGGSLQEFFTINQIVASLLELDNVDRVQFLINGEKVDTLMGHFTVDEPFENIME
ncbi:MAG: GerMN domain-containing protein [Tissierellaceae bacterium]